jgi:hypothetical protein
MSFYGLLRKRTKFWKWEQKRAILEILELDPCSHVIERMRPRLERTSSRVPNPRNEHIMHSCVQVEGSSASVLECPTKRLIAGV